MIYFDNAATTYPKPASVAKALAYAVTSVGGNPGRSGHEMSVRAAREVYKVRRAAAELFGSKEENTVFTLNCTHSLNLAIKGILKEGDHVIISSLEHNSVARPVCALMKKGVECSVFDVYEDDGQTLEGLKRLIKNNTKAVVCTVASNVTGRVLPINEIAALCRDKGIVLVCDGAQAAGVMPLKVGKGINFLCMPGHKGLYGPTGTGLLVSDGEYELSTIIEGGTGTTSTETEQTPVMPEKLESGTLNTVGIVALGKGIEFVKKAGLDRIHKSEEKLCSRLINKLSQMNGVTVYRDKGSYLPIVAFNVKNMHSSEVADYLSSRGFALRGGYQCAAVAHKYLGTLENGVVRFSPSVFNNESQVDMLCESIKIL